MISFIASHLQLRQPLKISAKTLRFGTPTSPRLKSAAFPAKQPSPSQKPFLFATDWDDTAIRWLKSGTVIDEDRFERTCNAVSQIHTTTNVLINTGDSLSKLKKTSQKPQVQPILHDLPVDYLSVSAAKELYVNDKQRPADEWINSLTESDQVSTQVTSIFSMLPELVDEKLRDYGFDEESDILIYSKIMDGKKISLSVKKSDQRPSVIELHFVSSDAHWDEQEALSTMLQSDLEADLHNADIQMDVSKSENRTGHAPTATTPPAVVDLYFKPHKAASVKEVLTLMDEPKAVITAGDSGDDSFSSDTKALAPEFFILNAKNKSDKVSVLNYPIQSGTQEALKKQIQGHPRYEQVEAGDLANGLLKQWRKASDSIDV